MSESNNNLRTETDFVTINHDDSIDSLLWLSEMILPTVHQANTRYFRLTAQPVFPIMSASNESV